MSEALLSPGDHERFFRLDHSLEYEGEESYFLRKVQAINAGDKVWMVNNFDTDTHVYGLWWQRRQLALVDDEDGSNFRIYVRARDDTTTMLEDVPRLIEAIERAERYWGIAEN